MISIILCNSEECRQMDLHKWLESEKAGHDLKDAAYFDWIEKYAALFRSWASSLPSECVGCGKCGRDASGECRHPFDEFRVRHISKV